MTPYLLIGFGLLFLYFIRRDYRDEETDALWWADYLWWDVNKTQHQLIFKITIILKTIVSILLILTGIVWLILKYL